MGEREHHPGKTFGGVGTYWARSRSVPTPAYSRAPGGGVETPVAGFGSLPSEFRLSLNMRHCPWCQRTCTKFNLPTLLPYTRIPRGQAEGFPVFPSFPPCGQAEGFPIFLSSPHGCPKPPSLDLAHAATSFISEHQIPSVSLVSRTSATNVPGLVTPLSGPSNT